MNTPDSFWDKKINISIKIRILLHSLFFLIIIFIGYLIMKKVLTQFALIEIDEIRENSFLILASHLGFNVISAGLLTGMSNYIYKLASDEKYFNSFLSFYSKDYKLKFAIKQYKFYMFKGKIFLFTKYFIKVLLNGLAILIVMFFLYLAIFEPTALLNIKDESQIIKSISSLFSLYNDIFGFSIISIQTSAILSFFSFGSVLNEAKNMFLISEAIDNYDDFISMEIGSKKSVKD